MLTLQSITYSAVSKNYKTSLRVPN